MDIAVLREAVKRQRVLWRAHALESMLARGIRIDDARAVLLSGEVIEEYPDDRPFPSALMMASIGRRPLHVVVAYDEPAGLAYVVTAYEPDTEHFESDFRTRRG